MASTNIDQERLISNLAHLGENAFGKYWKGTSIESLEDSWWNALIFAFDHIFFQGRRDALSQRYRNHAVAVLRGWVGLPTDRLAFDFSELETAYGALTAMLPSEEQIKAYVRQKQASKKVDCCTCAQTNVVSRTSLLEDLSPHFGSHSLRTKRERDELRDRLPLNKPADLIMFLRLLRFVASDTDHKNIFSFIASRVRDGNFREPHSLLDDIYGIADKIAAFLTRDVYLFLKRDGHVFPPVDDEQWQFLFPVDTWVEKVAGAVGFADTDRAAAIKQHFVHLCQGGLQTRFDPATVAQGLWYAGARSLDIFVTLLCKSDVCETLAAESDFLEAP